MAFIDAVHATNRDARWIPLALSARLGLPNRYRLLIEGFAGRAFTPVAIAPVVLLEVGPLRRVDARRVIGGRRLGAALVTGAELPAWAYRPVR